MKALQKTLFIIALLILATQTVRHAYLRWFRPTVSVLDRYEEPLKEDIKKTKSLNELVGKYDEAYKKIKAYEADKSNPKIEPQDKCDTEPYKSECTLEEAIRDWESKSKEIHELRFYWICGFILLIIGYFFYIKLNQWAGFTLLIAGFSEMIYWTSPVFWGDSSMEFERLLTNKFAFSILSLILLVIITYITKLLNNGSNKNS